MTTGFIDSMYAAVEPNCENTDTFGTVLVFRGQKISPQTGNIFHTKFSSGPSSN